MGARHRPVIDVHARERHFVDHLAPVWRAIPEALRGDFMVPRELSWRLEELGIPRAKPGAGDRPTLIASYGDLKAVRALGRERIALLQHGIGQSYGAAIGKSKDGPSYSGGRDNHDVSLFLCPNEHSASRWRTAYPGARVEIVGCPKLDDLPRKPERSTPPVVAFTFHWDAHVVNETRSGFLQFRPAIVAAKRRWTILGHGHPRLLEDRLAGAARFYARNGIEATASFEEVCRRADVLVFDNTSSGYEFAATGRPVVVLDAIPYRRQIRHGLRFWEAADVGVRVDRRVKVIDAIEEALRDSPARQRAREEALSIVYGYRTGAGRRAADVVLDWARELVPA